MEQGIFFEEVFETMPEGTVQKPVKWIVKPREQGDLEYLEAVRKLAKERPERIKAEKEKDGGKAMDTGEEEDTKPYPIVWRRNGGSDLGLVGLQNEDGRCGYVAKGIPREWKPDHVLAFSKDAGYQDVTNLSGPRTAYQGCLFGAKRGKEAEDLRVRCGGTETTVDVGL